MTSSLLLTSCSSYNSVDQAVSSYVNIYNTSFKEWSTIPDVASNLGFSDLLPQTIETYMLENGVSQLYIDEFTEGTYYVTKKRAVSDKFFFLPLIAFTRVNYAHVRCIIQYLLKLLFSWYYFIRVGRHQNTRS